MGHNLRAPPLLFPRFPLGFLDRCGERTDFDEEMFPPLCKCSEAAETRQNVYVHACTERQSEDAHF